MHSPTTFIDNATVLIHFLQLIYFPHVLEKKKNWQYADQLFIGPILYTDKTF